MQDTDPTTSPAPLGPVPDFYRPERYCAEDSVGYLMRRVLNAMSQAVDGRLCKPDSPTYPQWLPLHKLHVGKAQTVAELARECMLDAGSMTRLLDRLEAKGLCRRVRSVTDRRVVNIELTDEGSAAAQQVPEVLCQVQNEYLAGFDTDEWNQLKSYLHRILDNTQAFAAQAAKEMTPRLPSSAAMTFAVTVVAAVVAALTLTLTGCADTAGIDAHARLRDAASLGLEGGAASNPATPSADPAEARAAAVPGAVLPDARWWLGFGDAQLDALVGEALAGSPNLRSAQARLARAQAAVETVDAASRPQVNGALDLTRQKFSGNYIYPAPLGGSVRDTGTLQIAGSWEIDFFGKNRAALDAALGTANAAAAEADAAAVLLAANVARGYAQWARLSDQLAVARRTLAQRDETLRLVRDRVSAGLDTRLELRQSEGGLPEARQQIEALAEQIEIAQHALDALVGRPGATRDLAVPTLASLRGLNLRSDIPADLLGRRADIAAARWRVEAARGDVANARTLFYPNVSLTAFVGAASLGFGKLVESGSGQWGVGPALRLPIFEGGRLRANLRGRAADLDAAIESYNASVVDAVRDAADRASSATSVVRQQAEQRDAQTAAEGAYDIAVQRYRAGLGNYLNVLTAETAVLAQRRQGVDLAWRALDTQIGLAQALGGGWLPPTATARTDAAPRTASAAPVMATAAVAARP